MAELIRDEPAWTYRAATGPAARRLRVWRTDRGRLAAVLTENPADEGMSITNAAAVIEKALAREYPDDVTTVFEHYTPPCGSRGEHFDQVSMVWNGDLREGRYEPKWRPAPIAELIMLLGVDPSTVPVSS